MCCNMVENILKYASKIYGITIENILSNIFCLFYYIICDRVFIQTCNVINDKIKCIVTWLMMKTDIYKKSMVSLSKYFALA